MVMCNLVRPFSHLIFARTPLLRSDTNDARRSQVDGKMQGRGTMVWPQGERYDGEWLNGREHGRAVFTWPDLTFFDGVWREGVRHGFGVFSPANHHGTITSTQAAKAAVRTPSETSPTKRPGHEVLRPRRSLPNPEHNTPNSSHAKALSPSATLSRASGNTPGDPA